MRNMGIGGRHSSPTKVGGLLPVFFVKEFLRYYLEQDDVTAFDRMRRKRHAATYDVSRIVTHTDAEGALATAKALVSTIKAILANDGFVF
jgi:uncharacterized protein (UPF0332 family)